MAVKCFPVFKLHDTSLWKNLGLKYKAKVFCWIQEVIYKIFVYSFGNPESPMISQVNILKHLKYWYRIWHNTFLWGMIFLFRSTSFYEGWWESEWTTEYKLSLYCSVMMRLSLHFTIKFNCATVQNHSLSCHIVILLPLPPKLVFFPINCSSARPVSHSAAL